MKNILGTSEDLKLFDDQGVRKYSFDTELSGYSYERTYNSDGKTLLTLKDSDGYFGKCTRDSNGNQLTFEDLSDVTIIPEFTMEELVTKLGNFKIKK